MTNEEREWLRQFRFMRTRIPALDALATFVPHGGERDPAITGAAGLTGFSRWFPVEGGHRMLVPYEGGEYDATRFSIEKGAWDHETCKICRMHIDAMTLCWVTEAGPYVILCDSCKEQLA
jgi:hypothetical protein